MWLSYGHDSRWTVVVEPESPILAAHRHLSEPKFLNPDELGAFTIVTLERADGPVALEGYRGGERTLLASVSARLDPRLERINRQQYLRLAVIRRDAKFTMCGSKGTLVLSGKDLAGGRTKDALRPIHARLYAWPLGLAAVAAVASVAFAPFRGSSLYFDATNARLTLVTLVCVLLAAAPVGGLLRGLGRSRPLAALKPYERYLSIGVVGTVLVGLVVGIAARPRATAVDAALAAGDVPGARTIVTALVEKQGSSTDAKEANDAVTMAEARALSGDARLKLLDEVAGRGGTRASQAKALAREKRIEEIKRLVDAKSATEAQSAIDRWFGDGWRSDVDVAEQRARSHEVAAEQCGEDLACRLAARRQAASAATTSARTDQQREARASLLSMLSNLEVTAEERLARLQRLRGLSVTAAKTAAVDPTDTELGESAKRAQTFATTERAKVPLIGSEATIAGELLGVAPSTDEKATWLPLEGTRAFLQLDVEKKCRGVYVVGVGKDARIVALATAEKLLSQAVGRAVAIKPPPPPAVGASTSRWFENPVNVVARWRGGDLMELRIGDAAP